MEKIQQENSFLNFLIRLQIKIQSSNNEKNKKFLINGNT